MAPGLTSAGGKIADGVSEGHVVAVTAEGKKHAMAVGLMKMSGDDVREQNKGIAIEVVCFLNDSMWKLKID